MNKYLPENWTQDKIDEELEFQRENIERKVRLFAITVGGYARISRHGVPHVIVKVGNTVYSACYFGSTNTWRVFYPYPSDNQHKITFKSSEEAIKFIKGAIK